MRRLRLRTRPLALFGGCFVAALLALLPMRLALGWMKVDAAGLAARRVEGSLWLGTLREARLGGMALGDLDARMSPLPLVLGRARLAFAGAGAGGGTAGLHGALSASRHSFALEDATASLPGGAVFAPLPVGAIDLDAVSARFNDAGCESASGRVRATLSGAVAGVALGQSLSGAARCDGGALLLPLASAAGTERVALRLWQEGRYRAELVLPGGDPAQASRLQGAGFQRGPDGWRLSAEGRL